MVPPESSWSFRPGSWGARSAPGWAERGDPEVGDDGAMRPQDRPDPSVRPPAPARAPSPGPPDGRPAGDALASAPAPARVWVVAGAPGAGKSTLARHLAPLLRPVPALLDKDTLFSGFVREVLDAHGRSTGEREGAWYDRHVKVHEYGAMTAAAREIRAAGCPVMLVAPFTDPLRRPGAWREWVAELGGDPVTLLWVSCDPATLRDRILGRGRARDGGKVGDFDAFVARMRPDSAPLPPHVPVDVGAGAPPVEVQVRDLVGSGVLGPAVSDPTRRDPTGADHV